MRISVFVLKFLITLECCTSLSVWTNCSALFQSFAGFWKTSYEVVGLLILNLCITLSSRICNKTLTECIIFFTFQLISVRLKNSVLDLVIIHGGWDSLNILCKGKPSVFWTILRGWFESWNFFQCANRRFEVRNIHSDYEEIAGRVDWNSSLFCLKLHAVSYLVIFYWHLKIPSTLLLIPRPPAVLHIFS